MLNLSAALSRLFVLRASATGNSNGCGVEVLNVLLHWHCALFIEMHFKYFCRYFGVIVFALSFSAEASSKMVLWSLTVLSTRQIDADLKMIQHIQSGDFWLISDFMKGQKLWVQICKYIIPLYATMSLRVFSPVSFVLCSQLVFHPPVKCKHFWFNDVPPTT